MAGPEFRGRRVGASCTFARSGLAATSRLAGGEQKERTTSASVPVSFRLRCAEVKGTWGF